MKFKVGEQVKFLNEVGGGVVTKILSPAMVMVLIDEGFEVPTPTSDLIGLSDGPMGGATFNTSQENIEDNQMIDQGEHIDSIELLNKKEKGVLAEGVYFAFIPHDQKYLITGMMDWYLMNNSGYEVLFSVFRDQHKSFEGVYSGFVKKHSMKLIDSLDRDELKNSFSGITQVLFFTKEKKSNILNPGNALFEIHSERMINENNYKYSGLIDSKAIFVSLLSISSQLKVAAKGINEKVEKIEEPILEKAEDVNPLHVIDTHKVNPREAIVDLHLSELVEDEGKVKDHEKLKIQMDYFKACLKSAFPQYITKITFIHGVGKGVLKEAIINYLLEYPNIEVRDASMKEFGYGATIVLIRYNHKIS